MEGFGVQGSGFRVRGSGFGVQAGTGDIAERHYKLEREMEGDVTGDGRTLGKALVYGSASVGTRSAAAVTPALSQRERGGQAIVSDAKEVIADWAEKCATIRGGFRRFPQWTRQEPRPSAVPGGAWHRDRCRA